MRPVVPTVLIALIMLMLPAAAVAQSATPPPTPPETCLAVETFPLPAGDRPHDVAPAADGNGVWYTGQGAGVLGRLDPATGAVERVPLGDGSAPHGVIVGPDGDAWVTDGGLNAIVRVDQETLAVETLSPPTRRGWRQSQHRRLRYHGDPVVHRPKRARRPP